MRYRDRFYLASINLRRVGLTPLRGGVILGLATLLILGHYHFGEQSSISFASKALDLSQPEPRHIRDFSPGTLSHSDHIIDEQTGQRILDTTVVLDPAEVAPFTSKADDCITTKQLSDQLSRAYEDERTRLLEDTKFNSLKVASDIRAPQVFEPSIDNYIARLRLFVDEFFDGVESRIHLDRMLDNLERHVSPPLYRDEPMRKVVASTAKGGLAGVDEKLFPAWEEKLGPAGWTVEVADDEMTEEWFGNFTAGEGRGTAKWREIWDDLKTPVLKSDLIRLLAMLTWGGIYSDSDTRPRSHPYIWGNGYTTLTPASLRPLGELLDGIPRPQMSPPTFIPPSTHVNASQSSYADEYEGINMPDIGLVVSVEYDGLLKGYGTNPIFAREMQFIQSTMIAKPFHPIMLDALEKVVRNLETETRRARNTRRKTQQRFKEDRSVLDMTGPGPFSDAVWQYLLVQYGFSPLDLRAAGEDPARVGDILILPRWSFSQPLPQPNEWDVGGPHPEKRAVCHSMLGRWRNQALQM